MTVVHSHRVDYRYRRGKHFLENEAGERIMLKSGCSPRSGISTLVRRRTTVVTKEQRSQKQRNNFLIQSVLTDHVAIVTPS